MGNLRTLNWAKLAARTIAVTFVAQIAIPVMAQTTDTPAAAPANGATAVAPPAAAAYTGPRMPLLIFPFDSSEVEQEGDFLGRAVAKGLKDGTLRSPRYSGISYNPKNAVIQRALTEGLVKESETKGPFGLDPAQVANAVKVAQTMGASDYPLVMVGSVAEFEMDRTKNQAILTVTAQVVDVASGIVVETLVATGASPEAMVIGSDEQFALRAAENATNLLVAKMVPPTVTPDQMAANNGANDNGANSTPPTGENPANGNATETEQPKKKKKNSGIFAVLAILLGAAILGGGGGSGGGSSVDNPPAPPF